MHVVLAPVAHVPCSASLFVYSSDFSNISISFLNLDLSKRVPKRRTSNTLWLFMVLLSPTTVHHNAVLISGWRWHIDRTIPWNINSIKISSVHPSIFNVCSDRFPPLIGREVCGWASWGTFDQSVRLSILAVRLSIADQSQFKKSIWSICSWNALSRAFCLWKAASRQCMPTCS